MAEVLYLYSLQGTFLVQRAIARQLKSHLPWQHYYWMPLGTFLISVLLISIYSRALLKSFWTDLYTEYLSTTRKGKAGSWLLWVSIPTSASVNLLQRTFRDAQLLCWSTLGSVLNARVRLQGINAKDAVNPSVVAATIWALDTHQREALSTGRENTSLRINTVRFKPQLYRDSYTSLSFGVLLLLNKTEMTLIILVK